ncbi:prolyl oligopeptidase [Deinobacterium chartae]|uniref:prolyl oligopeptidase n=1 Tax=Deinobacterium chartae TaxID=521158 RepID=A0A841HXS7_9DEIO|nr:prolyl oligopeptidase family serine peptidase [Deinobacterium chartae]MBB6097673.1 prolyl oligopeptidase [Deinobacterium chartae]
MTRRDDHVDTYHGVAVPDPYRWLEDPNSEETRAWIEAQNALTFAHLETLPERAFFRERLTRLWDYPKTGVPFERGGKYFVFRNSGLQNQDVLYVAEGLGVLLEGGRVLLDPNTLSEDGTAALRNLALSRDGRYLAYAVSRGGSDWQEWFVRSVESGEDLPDHLSWSKFGGAAWLPDGSGFLYSRYPAPREGESLTGANYGQELYLHRIGTAQEADELYYARPDQPEWGFAPVISEDGRYLVVHVWVGTDPRNRLFYRDLEAGGEMVELIPDLEAAYGFVANRGSTLYLISNLEAPRQRLIAVDLTAPGRENWRTVIPEREDVLQVVSAAGDEFLALHLRDASHRLTRYGYGGELLGEITLPTLGSVTDLNSRQGNAEVFFGFASFLFPARGYRLDLISDDVEVLPSSGPDFDPEAFETRQLFARSKDGTRVPMFVVHRKDLELNGQNPTLLYGYGGFNIALTPSFSITRLPWLEAGGVLVIANLRGGGEYGEEWHQAGTVHRKQNVFDDFIACAEHLIREGYTSPQHLAIQGGSNGGLLVGAAMTQRPDLFAVALPAVGVLDMLRFHRFTIGWAWVSDYGSSEDPEQFQTLLKYSPLHNLRPGVAYPATLITTGDHDDRVVPAHSFKFAAELQHVHAGDVPVLIRIQTKAGHGAGKPTRLVIEEYADIWAFAAHYTGLEVPQD